MARRKKSTKKVRRTRRKTKINSKTVLNMFGLFLIGAGILAAIALFSPIDSNSSGNILSQIKGFLMVRFGILSFAVPLLLILISIHFFGTKKSKFVKLNTTFGSILFFVSILGVFQVGQAGTFIYENLSQDFSTAGAIAILSLVCFIGLILLFNTSVDVFILFVITLFQGLIAFFKNHVFRQLFEPKDPSAKVAPKQEVADHFIQDKKLDIKQPVIDHKPIPVPQQSKGMVVQPLRTPTGAWVYPPLDLLLDYPQRAAERGDVKHNALVIERTLESFGIRARVGEVNNGPTVTQYALEITMGTKLSKITALSNDLALALAAPNGQIRMEAPIPGRSLVGIEIPNIKPEIVTEKNLLGSSLFEKSIDPLLVPLGLDVAGRPQVASISKMPHVLIAGTTGSGKSLLLNAWITTFLFRTKPEELRLILVDPKRVELTLYNGIPHLLTEVIVEPEKIISALRWVVSEMENRYKEFSQVGTRNLEGFNAMEGAIKKPYIVFVIDELADLMIFAPGEAEDLITRIAQMARATGIHLVLATQRPSVDVITGLMKANIPTRIALNVSSMIDSRVIIDMPGAEKLLGKGDMLYLPPDQAKPLRIQGPYIAEKEVSQVVTFLKSQVPEVHYTEEITQEQQAPNILGGVGVMGGGDKDPLFASALEIIAASDKASASLLQRRLSVGYARAARLLDQLEAAGYVGAAEGSKPREVIRRQQEVQEG